MKNIIYSSLIFLCIKTGAVNAQISFQNLNGYGQGPKGSLTLLSNVLYGMTYEGGANNEGIIFSIDTGGLGWYSGLTDIYNFNNNNNSGKNPYGSLTLLGNKFYGMAESGGAYGYGVIFSIHTDGSGYTDIMDFNSGIGENPTGSLILLGNKLYGMANGGGTNGDGTIFSFDTNGSGANTLFNFNGTNGANPTGNLTISGGVLYGMTAAGGANNEGCIFSIGISGGPYAKLLDFNGTNGENPLGSLTLSGNVLYGMTITGGAYGNGIIFSIHTDGTGYSDLHDFRGYPYDFTNPKGSLTLSGNVLYGMASETGDGGIFSIDTNGIVFSLLAGFNGTDGQYPWGDVTLSGNVLYGMTYEGGTNGAGVVFRLYTNILCVTTTVIVNVSCNGGNNGSVSATPSYGTSPYTYLWSNGGTNSTNTGLTAGTYTITVTDNTGNTATSATTIIQPNVLSVLANTTANVSCNGGNNGNATATPSGGTSPYTYSWSDVNAQTTASASGLSMGTYTITLNDSCGSSATGSVTITQPNTLGISANTTSDVTCGGENNGIATTNRSGGTSPYTYSWSDVNVQTTLTATGLSQGTYTVTVTDACSNSATASATITQPAILTTTANVNNNTTECANTGNAISSPSGGTSPYTYIWTPSGETTAIVSSLSTGVYEVFVQDDNGCSATANVTITAPPALRVNATAYDSSKVANSSASVTVGGGVSPYTYSWSDANSQTTATATGLSAGSYTITVTDADNCIATASLNIVPTGINSITSNSGQITVYPNPNSGVFTIAFSHPASIAGSLPIIQVYNVLGQQVLTETLRSAQGDNSIDFISQPDGIYLYGVIQEDGKLIGDGKLIIQK